MLLMLLFFYAALEELIFAALVWFVVAAGVFRPDFANDYHAFGSGYCSVILLFFLRFSQEVGIEDLMAEQRYLYASNEQFFKVYSANLRLKEVGTDVLITAYELILIKYFLYLYHDVILVLVSPFPQGVYPGYLSIFRALAYIHGAIGVCHRDIKPQNLLVSPHTHQVKLCDFGSAKVLVRGEPNISYICSRYYRAPELIFGATEYTTAIDIWSAGCVMAELLHRMSIDIEVHFATEFECYWFLAEV
ncbi:hypothetical protein RHMOL_Rhmol11G0142900 [Rhododendron molle]|uniref:Uncharacterized protein n=1 Tax=Rhododendron molle TaxID=49168 RepID=A0ACC0LTT5_RHOML|nr:hypothetical protein RHMOL_Rhmol11G0142900 [Rhododendron molle]